MVRNFGMCHSTDFIWITNIRRRRWIRPLKILWWTRSLKNRWIRSLKRVDSFTEDTVVDSFTEDSLTDQSVGDLHRLPASALALTITYLSPELFHFIFISSPFIRLNDVRIRRTHRSADVMPQLRNPLWKTPSMPMGLLLRLPYGCCNGRCPGQSDQPLCKPRSDRMFSVPRRLGATRSVWP